MMHVTINRLDALLRYNYISPCPAKHVVNLGKKYFHFSHWNVCLWPLPQDGSLFFCLVVAMPPLVRMPTRHY